MSGLEFYKEILDGLAVLCLVAIGLSIIPPKKRNR
jgi:hypothetical protein